MNTAVFVDRIDAGRQLAKQLQKYKREHPIILALPRGGLPVGFEIAKALNAPMDIIFVRKIAMPGHEEVAIGAVVDGAKPQVIVNEDLTRQQNLWPATVDVLKNVQLKEIERRRKLYMPDQKPLDLRGQAVIVVDDGVATGATVRVVLKALRLQEVRKIIVAIPVAPPETLELLESEADAVICLASPYNFQAVGYHYRSFPQLTDEDVIRILEQSREGTLKERHPEQLKWVM